MKKSNSSIVEKSAPQILFRNITNLDEFVTWHNKEIEILGVIADPREESLIDAEAMPQFHVKLLSTGEIQSAYVDEIDEVFWTDEMKAVLAGQNACRDGNTANPYESPLSVFFNYGLELGDIKGLIKT